MDVVRYVNLAADPVAQAVEKLAHLLAVVTVLEIVLVVLVDVLQVVQIVVTVVVLVAVQMVVVLPARHLVLEIVPIHARLNASATVKVLPWQLLKLRRLLCA